MTEAPAFRIRAVELLERPVTLRLPFRFGVVTLTECPQAFARVRIEHADGSSHWGAAAELMAPKWFDKNLAFPTKTTSTRCAKCCCWARTQLGDTSPRPRSGTSTESDEHMSVDGALGFNLWPSYGTPDGQRRAGRAVPQPRRCSTLRWRQHEGTGPGARVCWPHWPAS